MDMGELTREEVASRIEAVEARIEARAQVTDSKIDMLGNEMKAEMRALALATDSKIDLLRSELEMLRTQTDARAQATDTKIEMLRLELDARAQATDSKIVALDYKIDSKVEKGFADVIKWMVGAAIAMMAIAVTVIIFMINTAVSRQLPYGGQVPAVSVPAPPR